MLKQVHGKENYVWFLLTTCLYCLLFVWPDMQTSAHLLLLPATATTISLCGTTTHQLIAALSSSTAAAVATKIDSTRGKTVRVDAVSASLSYRVLVRVACARYSLINIVHCCVFAILYVRFRFTHICRNICDCMSNNCAKL